MSQLVITRCRNLCLPPYITEGVAFCGVCRAGCPLGQQFFVGQVFQVALKRATVTCKRPTPITSKPLGKKHHLKKRCKIQCSNRTEMSRKATQQETKNPGFSGVCEGLHSLAIHHVGGTGLEPVTPSLSSNGTCDASIDSKALTPTTPAACTSACTSESKNANDPPPEDVSLENLAAALAKLPQADRERLVAMLTKGQ